MVARIFAILAIAGFAVIAVPLVTELPPLEELTTLAQAYVERTPEELRAQNVVTAVIVTYRGLDTLGEVSVLFIATAGVGFLLRRQGPGVRSGADGVPAESEGGPGQGPSEILTTGARILVPVVALFGVYIFTHGHLTPGGGFQGGVIVGTVVLMLGIAFGIETTRNWIGPQLPIGVISLGFLAFLLTGFGSVLLGGAFLEYTAYDVPDASKYGIELVEVGIGLVVSGVVTGLFFVLASSIQDDEVDIQ